MSGIGREIFHLMGICRHIEELRRIALAGDVFVLAAADHEGRLEGAFGGVFAIGRVRPAGPAAGRKT
jgi:hypothetical protein